MKLLRSARWLVMALLLSVIPASSHASVFISVGIAPPPLMVYEQPPCPQPGWMWQPGYWAYGPDGYYWVPGAWVPSPYVGALWTPGYWGWSTGFYVWHPGYWARHVGYYGGVNYGFGYMGIGFVGGAWRGREFAYNTAVVRVNNVYIHNTYIDRTIVERNTIINNRHVAYSGGPGGIQHMPTAQERLAMHDQHMTRATYLNQREAAARADHNAYFNANHGRPANVVANHPNGPMNGAADRQNPGRFNNRPQNNSFQQRQGNAAAPQMQRNNNGRNWGGASPQYRAEQPQNRPAPQYRANPQQYRQAPQYRANPPQYRAAPQQRPEPQYRPAPQWQQRGGDEHRR